MSLLEQLRVDIGDDDSTVSVSPIASGSPMLQRLRADIGDDGGTIQPDPIAPGNVVLGPGVSKDNGIATWDGTDGTRIQSTDACVDASGNIDTPGGATLGGLLDLNSAIAFNCREVTAAGGVTVNSDDAIVAINKTVGAATLVTLPSTTSEGRMVIIKDKRGDAFTNNITLVVSGGGTIDSLPGFIMSQNYQSTTLVFCAGSWSIA